MRIQQLLILTLFAGLSQTASAHTGFHPVEGWLSGFVHPLMGLDHTLAMLSVGLWAVCISTERRQVWSVPLAFLLVMMAGGLFGFTGFALPGIELGIAFSVVFLGLMISCKIRLPRVITFTVIGLFAMFHGFAHGAEMGHGTNPYTYALGFITATASLHLAGIYFGYCLLPKAALYRASGAIVGGIGLLLLIQAV